ncbi:hypothetical protein D9M71_332800 [compost metagenome]
MFGQSFEAAVQGHHGATQAAVHGLKQLMDGVGLQQGLWGEAAAMEVMVDGLAKVHAAGEHAQWQFDQRFPAQRRLAKGEEALVVEQTHAGFAEGQGVEMFGVQAFQVGNTEIQAIVRQLFEDLFRTQR